MKTWVKILSFTISFGRVASQASLWFIELFFSVHSVDGQIIKAEFMDTTAPNTQTVKHSGVTQLKHSIKKMIMSKIA